MPETVHVAWLSRHDMTKEQYDALEKIVRSQYGKDSPVSVENVGVHWQSSSDVWKDIRHNVDLWYKLLNTYDCITGILPPIAEEALRRVPGRDGIDDVDGEDEEFEFFYKLVMTPVTTRVVKNGKMELVFHRWIIL